MNEEVKAAANTNELDQIMDNYTRVLSGHINDVVEASPQQTQVKQMQEQNLQLVGDGKKIIEEHLGTALFNKVYEFLKYHRQKGTDEAKMYAQLKLMVGNNKMYMNHCFKLDGIVFMEILRS